MCVCRLEVLFIQAMDGKEGSIYFVDTLCERCCMNDVPIVETIPNLLPW